MTGYKRSLVSLYLTMIGGTHIIYHHHEVAASSHTCMLACTSVCTHTHTHTLTLTLMHAFLYTVKPVWNVHPGCQWNPLVDRNFDKLQCGLSRQDGLSRGGHFRQVSLYTMNTKQVVTLRQTKIWMGCIQSWFPGYCHVCCSWLSAPWAIWMDGGIHGQM